MSDFDLYTNQGTADLDNLRMDEIEEFVAKAPDEAVSLISHLTNVFAHLLKKFESLQEKHERASKMIAVLKNNERVTSEGKVG